MNTRKLGKTGYEVSEIGLGTWQLGESFGPVNDETAAEILKTARSLDVNFWDTADVYGGGQSERRIGAFKDKKGVFVATKLGRNGEIFPGTTGYNRKARQGQPRRLAQAPRRRDARPGAAPPHPAPTCCATARSSPSWTTCATTGMMRHWGASVENVEEALICLQGRWLHHAADHLQPVPAGLHHRGASRRRRSSNVGIIVRLPLASGLLSGKWTKDTTFADTDHRNFNAQRRVLQCRRDLLRPAVREGRGAGRRAQADGAQGHAAEPVRAALDARPAGGLDHHRRRHPAGPARRPTSTRDEARPGRAGAGRAACVASRRGCGRICAHPPERQRCRPASRCGGGASDGRSAAAVTADRMRWPASRSIP